MARQRRLIQIARRMLPLAGKGKTSPTEWEKKRDQANRLLYRKHGIPNAVQLGHTLSSPCSKDRICLGSAIAWPGLPVISPVGVNRGEVVEVCSPGPSCRDIAAQMALSEARNGSVLWMALGSQAAAYGGSVLQQVPNLTLQQQVIDTAADSKAALQDFLRMVRRQTYTMVVLDCVAGLAPPPVGSVAWPAAAMPATAPLQAQAMDLTPVAGQAEPVPWSGASAAGPGTPAAAEFLERFGAAAMSRLTALSTRAPAHPQTANPAAWHPAVAPCDGAAAPNFKFMYNVLPLLLEETLAELAASCGPELRTTTLLLNPYAWRAGDPQASPAAGLLTDSGARHRWARRAILRHVAATLHILPEVTGAVGSGADVSHGQAPIRCLRAVLSKGLPSGEDGPALRTWSLNIPVRLAPPAPHST